MTFFPGSCENAAPSLCHRRPRVQTSHLLLVRALSRSDPAPPCDSPSGLRMATHTHKYKLSTRRPLMNALLLLLSLLLLLPLLLRLLGRSRAGRLSVGAWLQSERLLSSTCDFFSKLITSSCELNQKARKARDRRAFSPFLSARIQVPASRRYKSASRKFRRAHTMGRSCPFIAVGIILAGRAGVGLAGPIDRRRKGGARRRRT
jgi:hypothetical protein